MSTVSDQFTPEAVAAYAAAQLQGAAQAVRNQDFDGMAGCLEAALSLYERYPSYAQEEGNLIGDVLVAILAARTASQALGRPDEHLQLLEDRAAMLYNATRH